jgi:UDP-N-acetylglucosamine 4,6-dehydratase/5-epimerase
MTSILKNKNILVTGGSGSIGQSIVKKSLEDGAKSIKVFSNDENGLYEMEQIFTNKKIEYVIGDIRNFETVNIAV